MPNANHSKIPPFVTFIYEQHYQFLAMYCNSVSGKKTGFLTKKKLVICFDLGQCTTSG